MFSIDTRNRVPLYEQLAENIRRLAVSGALDADTQLPSVRQLSSELGINPNTVQKAYAIAEERGYLYSLPGRGHFIAPASDEVRDLRRREARTVFEAAVKKALESGLTETDLIAVIREKEESSHD